MKEAVRFATVQVNDCKPILFRILPRVEAEISFPFDKYNVAGSTQSIRAVGIIVVIISICRVLRDVERSQIPGLSVRP